MNKKFNKILAAFLAGSMVLGTGITAFAADNKTGNTTGAGEFEGHVEKSVLLVQLPTIPADDKTFAYTMDPEGLIAATEGAKDKEASFESGATVYFLSAAKTYTKDSAKLKVVNKGSVDADVTVAAETAANAKVAMATSDTFAADNKTAQLYLGLKVADKAAVAVKEHTDGTDPVSVTVGLKGVPDNFAVKYDEATKKYSYEAKEGVAETAWNSFEFGLTGACNPNGDYSDASLTASTVTVTWSYDKRADDSTAAMLTENATAELPDARPSIPTASYSYDRTQDLDITVDFGRGDLAASSVTRIQASNDGVTAGIDVTSSFTVSGTKFTLQQGKQFGGAQVGAKRYLIFTFDEGTKVTVTLDIAK